MTDGPSFRELTGGVTVGWWRASRGLATLRVERDRLEIRAGSRAWVFGSNEVRLFEQAVPLRNRP